MVNDLLDLAKVEAGKIRIRPKHFEVHELFSALKGMLKPLLADNTSVDLIFDDAQGLPKLYTDEGKVSQILRNLISNALKFTPSGQVRVSAEAAGEHMILFAVADTGIGIPAEHHESIFREFSQVDNPLQVRHRGTGLGLPLCRNLAILLGGRIWLESRSGAGSTFYVALPTVYLGEAVEAQKIDSLPAPDFHRAPVLILEDNPETARVLEAFLRNTEFQPILATGVAQFLPKPLERETLLGELRRLTAQTGSRRLLLVDDNDVSRYILRELLQQPWLNIEEARNGREAIEALNRSLPDAVILDLLMPDISGFEILRDLRASLATEQLPVLIYTSKFLSEAERAQLESWRVRIVRKEDVSTRLSAQPFLDWFTSAGLTPPHSVADSSDGRT